MAILETPLSSVYYTTMSEGNTAAENSAAFVSDANNAKASGKDLYIPFGEYPWGYTDGTQSTITVNDNERLRVVCDGTLVVASGSSNIPFIVTTTTTDYTVTTVSTVTSGGGVSTGSEVTMITLSSAPTDIKQGDIVSVFSNDLLAYNDGDSANFAHEMAMVLSVSGSDVYLARKLNRTYTTSNYVRLRQYANRNAVVEWVGGTFDANGDIESTGVTNAQRPSFVVNFIGFRNILIDNVRFYRSWAGGFRYNSTCGLIIDNCKNQHALNGLSGVTVLGYMHAFDGANLAPKVRGGSYYTGRHITSTFQEQSDSAITAATVGATTVFTHSGDTGDDNFAVGDLVYITGLVGTISAMNNAWYTITARTGSGAAGGTFTVAYNSTGLAYTSGGTAQIYQPDLAYRTGEMEEMEFTDVDALFGFGTLFDSHNNSFGMRINGGKSIFPVETTWGGIDPRAASFRGCSETIENFRQVRGNKFINIFSFSQNHGLANMPLIRNIHLNNQQDKDAASAYISTSGSASVTDKRKLLIDGLLVDGGAYRVIEHVENAGNVEINDFFFNGDWGLSGTSAQYILANEAGEVCVIGGHIDLRDNTVNDEVRIAQVTKGGTIRFINTRFSGLSATTNYPFSIATTASGKIVFDGCAFEFDSTATDGTVRLCQVNNVAGTYEFNNCKLVNAAKLHSSLGLVNSASASGNATVKIGGDFIADAPFLFASSTSSGVFAVTRNLAAQLVKIEANTAGSGSPNVLSPSESGLIFTNEGSTAKNYHTLPTAVAGLLYTGVVQDADGLRITAAAGDTIRISGSVSAAAGYVESTTIGSVVTLASINATEWVALSTVGTWSVV